MLVATVGNIVETGFAPGIERKEDTEMMVFDRDIDDLIFDSNEVCVSDR